MITIRIGNPTHSETKVKDYKEAENARLEKERKISETLTKIF